MKYALDRWLLALAQCQGDQGSRRNSDGRGMWSLGFVLGTARRSSGLRRSSETTEKSHWHGSDANERRGSVSIRFLKDDMRVTFLVYLGELFERASATEPERERRLTTWGPRDARSGCTQEKQRTVWRRGVGDLQTVQRRGEHRSRPVLRSSSWEAHPLWCSREQPICIGPRRLRGLLQQGD